MADTWYNQSWAWRQQVNFSGTGLTTTLTNVPALVKLNATRVGDYTRFATRSVSGVRDGLDIRFTTSDGTLCPYEIEHWNTSGESIIWVRIPSITNAGTYLWMYFGNAAATTPTDAASVWSNGYVGVWHLNQTAGAYVNSVTPGTLDSDAQVLTNRAHAGLGLGPCPDFVGTVGANPYPPTNYITVADATAFDALSSFTVEAMIQQDTLGGSTQARINSGTGGFGTTSLCPVISKGMAEGESATADTHMLLGIVSSAQYGGVANGVGSDFEDFTNGGSDNCPCAGVTATTVDGTHTYHIAQAVTAGTGNPHSVFLNGVNDRTYNKPYTGTGSATSNNASITPTTTNISKFAIGSGSTTTARVGAFDGRIDEVRLSDSHRTNDWMLFTYNTNTDTAQTYITPEQYSNASTYSGTITAYASIKQIGLATPTISAIARISNPSALVYEDYLIANYNTNLVAYWPLDDTGDHSGNNHTINSSALGTGGAFADQTGSRIANSGTWPVKIVPASTGTTYIQLEAVRTRPTTGLWSTGTAGATASWTGVGGTGTSSISSVPFSLAIWFRRNGTGYTSYTGSGGITYEPFITKGRDEQEYGGTNLNYALGLESLTHYAPSTHATSTRLYLAADFEKLADNFASGTAVTTAAPWDGRNTRMINYAASSGRLQITNHGFSDGDRVKLGGTVPSGTVAGTWYYVRNPDVNSFQISTYSDTTDITPGDLAMGTTGAVWLIHARATRYVDPTDTTDWHFAVLTYDGTYLRTYLDGQLAEQEIAQNNPPEWYTYAPAIIGGAGTTAATPGRSGGWNGWFAHASIWNGTALSDAQVTDLYAKGTSSVTTKSGTVTARADILKAATPVTVTAIASIESATKTRTITANADIKVTPTPSTLTARARIVIADSWYDQAWTWRQKISFAGTGLTTTLTNIPALVKLNATRVGDYTRFATRTQSSTCDGLDIRFTTSDGTLCPYEIEHWNTAGESIIWVRIPSVTSTGTYLWMYYGNTAATAPTDAATVWSNGYRGVWHLNQSTGHYLNSVNNTYLPSDAEVFAGTSSRTHTGIGLGPTVYLDGGLVSTSPASYITIADDQTANGFLNLTNYCLEAMVRPDSIGAAAANRINCGTGSFAAGTFLPVVSKGMADAESVAADTHMLLGFTSTSQYYITAGGAKTPPLVAADFEDSSTGIAYPNDGSPCEGQTTCTLNGTNVFHIAQCVQPGTGGHHRVLRNGIVDRDNTLPFDNTNNGWVLDGNSSAVTPNYACQSKLAIGCGSKISATPYLMGAYAGVVDEVRLSSTDRSADWMHFTYDSNTDTLQTYAAPEQVNLSKFGTTTARARIKIPGRYGTNTANAYVTNAGVAEVSWVAFTVFPIATVQTSTITANADIRKAATPVTTTARADIRKTLAAPTVQAVADIRVTKVTPTVTGYADIRKTAIPVTTTARADIRKPATPSTITVRADIRKTATPSTVTARADIRKTLATPTLQARANVRGTKTLTARANIRGLKTLAARAWIKDTGNFVNITAYADIKKISVVGPTITARADVIKKFRFRTTTATANIKKTVATPTISASGWIKSSGRYVNTTARADIKKLAVATPTLTARADIRKAATPVTKTARADVRRTLATPTVTVHADIRKAATPVTKTANAWIKSVGTLQTIVARADIKKFNVTGPTTTVRADVRKTVITPTIQARADIKKAAVAGPTITIHADIRKAGVNSPTIAIARARIRRTVITPTVTARANIRGLKTISAYANVRGGRTILAHADIRKPATPITKTARADIRKAATPVTTIVHADIRKPATPVTKQARANIRRTATPITKTARADIKKLAVTGATLNAVARIKRSPYVEVTAKADVKRLNVTGTTLTARADVKRLNVTGTTLTARADIRRTVVSTALTSYADIRKTVINTDLAAFACIKPSVSRTATKIARAYIRPNIQKSEISGYADIYKRNIRKPITVAADIIRRGKTSTLVTAYARIYKLTKVAQLTATASIGGGDARGFAQAYAAIRRTYKTTVTAQGYIQVGDAFNRLVTASAFIVVRPSSRVTAVGTIQGKKRNINGRLKVGAYNIPAISVKTIQAFGRLT